MLDKSLYVECGFTSRREYLKQLAEDYGVDTQTVFALANVLGPDEDFDGLVLAIEDEADRLEFQIANTNQLNRSDI